MMAEAKKKETEKGTTPLKPPFKRHNNGNQNVTDGCYTCGATGHWATECHLVKRSKAGTKGKGGPSGAGTGQGGAPLTPAAA